MNPLYGSFTSEDWERICQALDYYFDKHYSVLAQENASDREWTECYRYKHILEYIQYFILPDIHHDIKPIQDQT